MSSGYAQRLTKGVDYGVCGLPERVDNKRVLTNKVSRFAELVKKSEYIVAHTGAGISTAAGIPDFRGPKGVWTLEQKGKTVATSQDISWEAVTPTLSHMFLVALHEMGKLKFIISQNVDSLHIRSGIPRSKMAELHGNVFKEVCSVCNTEYFRPFDIQGIGFKETGRTCEIEGCDGKLKDELLDWEDALPDDALEAAEEHCKRADLAICLGTSLRVTPASELPFLTVQNGGKMCIINLQKTEKDNAADVRAFDYCDHFIGEVVKILAISVPIYSPTNDYIVTKKTLIFKRPIFDTSEFKKEKRGPAKVKRERKGHIQEKEVKEEKSSIPLSEDIKEHISPDNQEDTNQSGTKRKRDEQNNLDDTHKKLRDK